MISVNITTTFSRSSLCSATLWSLINQSVTPDAINLWISHDSYLADGGFDKAPEWVAQLNSIKNIIKVRFTSNIGPYRKMIPVLREADIDDIIVYADDDVIYGEHWLAKLYDAYMKCNKKNVVATRVRIKQKNFFGKNKSYNLCRIENRNALLNSNFIITGIGGCILSKSNIDEALLNINDYKIIAPKTDDIWFSKVVEKSNCNVYVCAEALAEIQEIKHTTAALNVSNTIRHVQESVVSRQFNKMTSYMLGYCGFPISNNDKMIKHVDEYFEKVCKNK
ncbi:glycosyltransferase family 2 protein [Kosakonia oryzae]|uniref:Glycosyl transferase family 2 n=1 Tax=Kosakonia oryzae TaxID=497725 RepID=A0AA94H3V5_9ENTR|nr:glycosyltransferase [Kosakonia oryzae]ANI82284.2 glycosyltransferase [Kosakonia oryzae]SFC53320.1 Glycosyl transferase family 2 [Kosakonia oryzae]